MTNDMPTSVLVTDTGFGPETWTAGFTKLDGFAANGRAGLDLASDTDPSALVTALSAPLIRINFPSFADGRGFTLARRLRVLGYTGRLRACGHVIADQYAMARRAGFDEIEITTALADRQPEADWLARANWQENDYQSRLRA